MGEEEKITSVLAVDEFKEDEYLVLLTQVLKHPRKKSRQARGASHESLRHRSNQRSSTFPLKFYRDSDMCRTLLCFVLFLSGVNGCAADCSFFLKRRSFHRSRSR